MHSYSKNDIFYTFIQREILTFAKVVQINFPMEQRTSQTLNVNLEEIGRRMKPPSQEVRDKLNKNNFQCQSEDSIDISQVMKGPNRYFDPATGIHMKAPLFPQKLRGTNFSQNGSDQQKRKKFVENNNVQVEGEQAIQPIIQEQQVEKMVAESVSEDYPKKQTEFKQITFSIPIRVQNMKISQQPAEMENEKMFAEQKYQKNPQKQQEAEENFQEASQSAQQSSSKSQSFSQNIISQLYEQFASIDHPTQIPSKNISNIGQKYNISKKNIMSIYKNWLKNPHPQFHKKQRKQKSFTSSQPNPKQTKSRTDFINKILTNNPYLSLKQIGQKILQKEKLQHRLKKDEITELIRLAGFKKKKVQLKTNEQEINRMKERNKQFALEHIALQEKSNHIFFIGYYIFHPWMFKDSFRTKFDQNHPVYSPQFQHEAIFLIAFLYPTGNLIWDVRASDYPQKQFEEFISTILKRVRKQRAAINNAIVVSQTFLNKQELAKQISEQNRIKTILCPHDSKMNPLDILFNYLKQKSKQFISQPTTQLVNKLHSLLNSLPKQQLKTFISNAQQYVRKISYSQQLE